MQNTPSMFKLHRKISDIWKTLNLTISLARWSLFQTSWTGREGGFNSCGIIIMIMETRDLCNSWLFQQVQALGGGRNLDYLRQCLFENGVSSCKGVFLQYLNIQECIPSSTRVYSSEIIPIIIISAIEAAPQDNAIFKICHYGFQQTSFSST